MNTKRDDLQLMPRRAVGLTITEVDAYIQACFARESQPQISELASQLGVSRDAVTHAFRRAYGSELSNYFRVRRHEYAAKLLLTSRLTTAQIAYRAGYGTRRSFYRSFRAIARESPHEYRERRRHG